MSSQTGLQHRADRLRCNQHRRLRTHGSEAEAIQAMHEALRQFLGRLVVDRVEVQFPHQIVPKLVQSNGAWPLS